jgi:hypothetical protein
MPYKFNPFTGQLDNVNPSSTAAVPGGTSGQMQYNNAGAFGGTASVYYDAANGRLGINTATPNERLSAAGNFEVVDTAPTSTKSYRFRTNGSNLDIEGSGKDIFLSVWSGANYTGTQYNYFRLEAGVNIGHAIGLWLFDSGPFGGGNAKIDGATGDVTIGGAIKHTGTTAGFYNKPAAAQPGPYTVTNVTPVTAYDPTTSTTVADRQAIGTIFKALQSIGLFG